MEPAQLFQKAGVGIRKEVVETDAGSDKDFFNFGKAPQLF